MIDAVSYKGKKLKKVSNQMNLFKGFPVPIGNLTKIFFNILEREYKQSVFHWKDWTKQPLVVPIGLNHSVICVAVSRVSSDRMRFCESRVNFYMELED